MTVKDPPLLKIFASEEQIWHAVADHGVDHGKIPALDFACLCVIAQHRQAGVLQPDLVRITGQDPRSVPNRTQRLCDGGYVVKNRTLAKNGWTSLLTLKKFCPDSQRLDSTGENGKSQLEEDVHHRSDARIRGRHTVIEGKVREGLQIVTEARLIVWNDLKRKLVNIALLKTLTGLLSGTGSLRQL
jgi:hypothetical protein